MEVWGGFARVSYHELEHGEASSPFNLGLLCWGAGEGG